MINNGHQLGDAGTQNAALRFGGLPGAGCTEEYNGVGWSAGGNFITGRCYLMEPVLKMLQ